MGEPLLKPLYGKVVVLNNENFNHVATNVRKYRRTEARNGMVEPIRNQEDINRIADYLYSKKLYAQWCMFVVCLNCGLRISDVVRLRVLDVADPQIDGRYVVKQPGYSFRLMPWKTRSSKKYVTIRLNEVCCKAIQHYIDTVCTPGNNCSKWFKTTGWLFPSSKSSPKKFEGTDKYYAAGEPIKEDSVSKLLKQCQRDLELSFNLNTHSMRKTFGYRFFRQYQSCGQEQMALATLQQLFSHSSPAITLKYICISEDEISSMIAGFDAGIKLDNLFEED